MKRFLTAGFALAVLLTSNLALADRDDHRNNGRDPHGNFDNRHDSRGWERNRGFRPNYRNNRDHRSYRRDHDDVNWSVNLSIGAQPFGYNPFGYNMLGYRPQVRSYRSREPVVIYQNNTYIEPSHSTSYVTRNTNRQGVSLLRDSNGNCFERVRDRFGNETRTQLPRSSCNF
jgi:hypothetical protein